MAVDQVEAVQGHGKDPVQHCQTHGESWSHHEDRKTPIEDGDLDFLLGKMGAYGWFSTVK